MKWEYYSVRVAGNIDVESLDEAGSQGWELVAICGEAAYLKRPLSEPDAKPVRIVHGENCPKVEHGRYDTFIHDADFDGTYQVDGIPYCGRCHRQIESYGEVKSVPSEADRLKLEIATDMESKLGEMHHDILDDGTTGVLKYAYAVWLLDLTRSQHEDIRTLKKELESACRRHAAELERAAQYKGISIQYREIVCTLCEAIQPIVDHFESGKSSATIPDGYLQELVRAYRETKAGICAEVENGK